MSEISAEFDSPLMKGLKDLYYRISSEPRQPLNQLAEEAVLHWIRVLDGQEIVQPRLNERGYTPTGFHFGMETASGNLIDHAGISEGPEAFEVQSNRHLEALKNRLAQYFDRSGHRSSSDSCDQTMVELARFSRFINTWAGEAERAYRWRWQGRSRAESDSVNIYEPIEAHDLLGRTRRALALWEPPLNTALIAWEENQLEAYEAAMGELADLLVRSPEERLEFLPPPGYPLRRRGFPRQKVSVFEPEQRPLRSRSVFGVRFHQLEEKIVQGTPQPTSVLEEVVGDVNHFSRMVETNLFMLATLPGLHTRGRPGVSVIRGRPTTHPFLVDAPAFFKKAVLFHNGTYTVAGGGLDQMFLQLRQLERMARFDQWGDWARNLRTPLEHALIAWEENRWDGFTVALLQVADLMRAQAEHSPHPT